MSDEQFATAFDDAAQEYERGRPGYPREAIDALIRELHLDRQVDPRSDATLRRGNRDRAAGRDERRLDPAARHQLLGEVSDLLGQPGAPIKADQVVVPMKTDVYWTTRA